MSNSHFCIYCGRKLKPGAKFCTKCGAKQDRKYLSEQKNYSSAPLRQSKSLQTNTSSSKQTRDNISSTKRLDKDSKQSFTITTLITLEGEIQDYSQNITLLENEIQASEINTAKRNEFQSLVTQIESNLANQTKIKIFIQQISWNQLKENKKKYHIGDNFQELQFLLYLVTEEIINDKSAYANEVIIGSDKQAELKSLNDQLKQKQNALEENHRKWLNGITNFQQYGRLLTNISYFQAKSIEVEGNLFFINKIKIAVNKILEMLQAIKFETEYSISGIFSYNQILTSLENETFKKIIQCSSTIENYRLAIESLANQIKYKESITFPKYAGIIIIESILKDYLSTESFSKTVLLIENIESLYKNSIEELDKLSDSLSLSQQSLNKTISSLKDQITKMRQEHLMEGRVKTNFANMPIVPELEKQEMGIGYKFDFIPHPDFYINLDNNNIAFFGKTLSNFALTKDQENKEKTKEDSLFEGLQSSSLDNSVFKISMPRLPKLTSMNSSFLISEEENEIKSELRKINYQFKKISFETDFKAECSFYTGSIKLISFDFTEEQETMHVQAELRLDIDKDIYFILKQESERINYSWENPYAGIQIVAASDDTKKKLLKERRIAQKFNTIPGKTEAIVTRELIDLHLENRKEVIQPVIEFLKETSFILNLSFRF